MGIVIYDGKFNKLDGGSTRCVFRYLMLLISCFTDIQICRNGPLRTVQTGPYPDQNSGGGGGGGEDGVVCAYFFYKQNVTISATTKKQKQNQ